jgi:deoxyribose-phosphate aldolase
MENKVTPEGKIKAAGGVRTLNGFLSVQKTVCPRDGATAMGFILEEAKKNSVKNYFLISLNVFRLPSSSMMLKK